MEYYIYTSEAGCERQFGKYSVINIHSSASQIQGDVNKLRAPS